MRKRIIAALAAIGLVAAMTGFGSIPAAAEETGDETTTVVDDTTTPPAEETTAEEETTEEESTEEESTEESTEEESTEESTEEESTEESTEEESTEEASTEEDATTEEEESTEEETKTEEETTPPAEDELPVVDGFTPEQVAEAQAFVEANGLGASARFFGIEICHWQWWSWSWDTESVGILGYALHYLYDSYDIMPGIFGLFDKNLDTDFGGLTGQQIYDNGCSKKVKVYHDPYWTGEYCFDGVAQPGSLWVYYTYQMEGKATWIIDGDGYHYEVPYEHGWVEILLPTGDYTVELVSNGGWYVKHGGPFWVHIDAALNCGCTVNPEANDLQALAIDILAEPTPCAEAEVIVTPPTCEAAGTFATGATFLATFGVPELAGLHYKVTATSDPGYRFYPDTGVPPDGLTKVFEGDLLPQLTNCGTLPSTGAADSGTPLWLAALAIMGGIGALVVSTRRNDRVVSE